MAKFSTMQTRQSDQSFYADEWFPGGCCWIGVKDNDRGVSLESFQAEVVRYFPPFLRTLRPPHRAEHGIVCLTPTTKNLGPAREKFPAVAWEQKETCESGIVGCLSLPTLGPAVVPHGLKSETNRLTGTNGCQD